jgi:hypothetical protein
MERDRICDYNTGLQSASSRDGPPLCFLPTFLSECLFLLHLTALEGRDPDGFLHNTNEPFLHTQAGKVCVRWRKCIVTPTKLSGVW